MLKKSFGILAVMLCAALLLISCKSPTDSSNNAVSVSRLKINEGDISGWTINNSNVYYSTDSWAHNTVDGVDGQAWTFYNTAAYSEALDENMIGSGGAMVAIWILNNTTAANASAEYNASKTLYSSNAEPLTPTFVDSVAIGNNSYSAITVYAHFKQFFVQLAFANYNSNFTLSKTDAITFLQLIEAKVNGM
jgi:hypothetical protein